MVVLGDLMALAANERASNQVRAIASWKLEQLKNVADVAEPFARLMRIGARFCSYSLEQIKRFQDDPKKMNLTPAQAPPDGQPIGMQLQIGHGSKLTRLIAYTCLSVADKCGSIGDSCRDLNTTSERYLTINTASNTCWDTAGWAPSISQLTSAQNVTLR